MSFCTCDIPSFTVYNSKEGLLMEHRGGVVMRSQTNERIHVGGFWPMCDTDNTVQYYSYRLVVVYSYGVHVRAGTSAISIQVLV